MLKYIVHIIFVYTNTHKKNIGKKTPAVLGKNK